MADEPGEPGFHADPQRFREALSRTEAETGFSARLIEKDYFCTLILGDLTPMFDLGLVFKGGYLTLPVGDVC
ncbi:hypothetical protein [Aquisphaera insulae]|uniref:hypothetical protein n=1 Tax=Aquisphaera insulae TaxID=2712864 RepID=UPI0013EC3AAF|nr:hypothetical protein [Aquisphaera insulae]